MKKLAIGVGVVIVLILLLLVVKNAVIKKAVQTGVKKATGLELTIRDMDVGIISARVDVRDMRLLNPPAFPDRIMIDIPKFLVDVELLSFFRDRIHIEVIELDLNELTVVRNKDGKLNLAAIKAISEKQQKAKKETEKRTKETKPKQILIETLHLKIGKVTYKDYALGIKGFTKTFKIGINEIYHNVTDPQQLIKLVIVRALQKTDVPKLADFDLGAIEGDVKETLKTVQSAAKESGEKELKEVEESATKELEKTVGKDLIEGLKKQTK